MRRMTRPGEVADVASPWDGSVFEFKGERAWTETSNGVRLLHLDAERTGRATYRITRVIGGRTREDFAGVDVTDHPARRIGADEEEFILPVSWVIPEDGSEGWWRYKGYSVLVTERPGLHVSAAWNRTCVFCHNTMPMLSRGMGGLLPTRVPYQAPDLDGRLPEELRWRWDVIDPEGLDQALREEIDLLGGPPPPQGPIEAILTAAVETTRTHLRGAHLEEVGIGCESCHLGGRQHAENPYAVAPSFLPKSPLIRVTAPDGADPPRAVQINRTCATCHGVLFSRYPHTWEGGVRGPRAGGSVMNSGEGRDFALGGCASQMSCVDCHDPHAKDDPARHAALATAQGHPTCTGCHIDLSARAARQAHTGHDPDGEGSACVSCHMPKKNIALQARLTRYHRILSPNAPEVVERERPMACSLCHDDWTVGRVVAEMADRWPTPIRKDRVAALFGGEDRYPLDVALTEGLPHEQVVALHTLAERGRRDRVAAMAEHLTHAYPLVRYHAQAALERLTGGPVEVDLHQSKRHVDAQVRDWLKAWSVR